MKTLMTHLEEHPVLANLAALGSFAIMGIVAARVIKKQSRAAQIRQEHPTMTYHQSVCQAYRELGYDQPFKV